jgi:Ca2+-binding RTX toxin-like protein
MKTLAAVTLVLTFALAGPAGAATVSSDGNTVRYAAEDASTHSAVIADTPEQIRVTQVRGSALRPGPGCSLESVPAGASPAVTCPRGGVARVLADMGGGPDSIAVALTPSGPPLTVNGGANTDTVEYSIGGGPVAVTLDGAPGDGRPARGDNIGADVENVGGTAADDSLIGNDAQNFLNGGPGRDMLATAGDDDVVDAREFTDCGEGGSCPKPERDTISCGDGRDVVDGDSTDDVAADCELVVRDNNIFLTPGDDEFAGFRPNLGITGGRGDDRITGLGDDRLEGSSGNDVLRAGPSGENIVRGGSGNDEISGNRDSDTIAGGYGRDRIGGGPAKDSIDGGAGRDVLFGHQGNDRIVSRERRDEPDRVSCGSGRDTVIADRNDRISRDCERVVRG